jgi:16S rRNA (guanine527-N7)-methyltransferase
MMRPDEVARMSATLSPAQIARLIAPFYPQPSNPLPDQLLDQLSVFLELLLKWNLRTNLTAIREPEEIVRRHFGESLFMASHLPSSGTLLDLGSGAGFPGLPIQLARPGLQVTLAESQHKKASFLREVVRTLALPTVVWGDRAENLPPDLRFDVVALRAVDRPEQALALARSRVAAGGLLAHLTASPTEGGRTIPLPGAEKSFLQIL